MDSLRHDYPSRHSRQSSAEWTTVNRQLYRSNTPMDLSPGDVAVTQGLSPTTPTTKPAGNPYKTPATSGTRPLPPILPRPHPIFRHQAKNARLCLVCSKPNCVLTSHKHFAEAVVAKPRSKMVQSPLQPGFPRPSQARSRVSVHPATYPVAMDAERHQLLSLWSQDWGSRSRGIERHLFPVRWIDLVLPAAMTHAALFQALLATVASMWEMAHANTTLSEPTIGHLRLADHVLEQACTTQQRTPDQDECLLAALLLVIVHLARGDANQTDQRFSRLVGLVHSRGGPPYLGMSGVVTDVLLYVDYLQAVMLNCEPVWKLPLPALQVGLPPRLGSGFRVLVSSGRFNVDLLMAADSVCRTADIFEQPAEIQAAGAGPMNAFGYLSTVSEYQLAHCNAVLHNSHTWNECICLALLLFNHVVLRNDGFITFAMRRIEQQFWQTVDSTISRTGFQDTPPCLLLWLFITGLSSCVLSDCPYRMSAIKRMRAAKISAVVNGWDQFRHHVLDDYLWMPTVQEEAFRDVWLEVEGYRPGP